jgi:hypothetical protein
MDIEKWVKETEKEYQMNKDIIKVRATLRDKVILIERLDSRKASKQELEKLKLKIPLTLFKKEGDSSICYIDVGEPKVTKYLIGDKEVSKQKFGNFQKQLKKKLDNSSLTENERKAIVEEVVKSYNS